MKSLKKALKSEWAIDVTGIMCEANIAFATYEKIYGVEVLTSLGNRALATANAYAGMGYLLSKIIDYSDKLFKIDRTKEKNLLKDTAIGIHDAFYSGMVTLGCSYLIYTFTNPLSLQPKEPKEILFMAIGAGILGASNGWSAIYSRDIFRDLVGSKECSRPLYPKIIKKQSRKIKKRLAAGFVAASLGITTGIIASNSNKENQILNQPNIIQVEKIQNNLETLIEE